MRTGGAPAASTQSPSQAASASSVAPPLEPTPHPLPSSVCFANAFHFSLLNWFVVESLW